MLIECPLDIDLLAKYKFATDCSSRAAASTVDAATSSGSSS
ncbi:hypothetical protein [Bacillus sp. FJAT-27264]|nr:hypothetical protein [Bacillus sp. FJAT-27264]